MHLEKTLKHTLYHLNISGKGKLCRPSVPAFCIIKDKFYQKKGWPYIHFILRGTDTFSNQHMNVCKTSSGVLYETLYSTLNYVKFCEGRL